MNKTDLTQSVSRHERGTAANAVRPVLQASKNEGMAESDVRSLVKNALGYVPSEKDFRQIMFKVRYSVTDGRFYAMGYGPKKPKKDKTKKRVSGDGGQPLEFKDVKVTVERPGLKMTVDAKLVKIVIGVLVLALPIMAYLLH